MAAPVLVLVIAGLAIGLVFAFPVTRLLKPYLFGVTERDPEAYIATFAVLIAVAAVASILPTRRLRQVSPASVLAAD